MLKCGGVLLDVLGRTIRLNAQAERHLGRGLTLTHGHLGAQHRHENAALQRLLGSVLQAGPVHQSRAETAVAISRPDGRPLIVHAAPIVGAARNIFQRAKAILMIVDPDEHQEPAIPMLRQAFGLSPAEARLASEIGNGRDLKEIAVSHGVSEGTLRAQLKAIFAKTDTHRQAELVALISRMISPSLRR
jgi:DNA-binding CsgD family transcriptional regulator